MVDHLTSPRSLLRHAGSAGKIGGRLAALAHHMEVAMAAAGVGPDGEDPLRLHRQGLGGALELQLLLLVAPALPGDQRAALAEQRRGELGEGREPADRTRRDRVEALPAGAAGELLRARVDDL